MLFFFKKGKTVSTRFSWERKWRDTFSIWIQIICVFVKRNKKKPRTQVDYVRTHTFRRKVIPGRFEKKSSSFIAYGSQSKRDVSMIDIPNCIITQLGCLLSYKILFDFVVVVVRKCVLLLSLFVLFLPRFPLVRSIVLAFSSKVLGNQG